MDILCVSDWIDPIIYSEQLKYRMNGVDFVISCGDISFSYLDFIMSELNVPIFFVVGNHINENRLKKNISGKKKLDAPNCFHNLHLKFHNIKETLICGFQGTVWYNGGPFQYKQWEVYFHLLKLLPRLLFNKIFKGRFIDIFVAHSPPFGVGDKTDPCHNGLKAFNLFIKLFKPKYFLHGHIHLTNRNDPKIVEYYKTKVINCSGFYRSTL